MNNREPLPRDVVNRLLTKYANSMVSTFTSYANKNPKMVSSILNSKKKTLDILNSIEQRMRSQIDDYIYRWPDSKCIAYDKKLNRVLNAKQKIENKLNAI